MALGDSNLAKYKPLVDRQGGSESGAPKLDKRQALLNNLKTVQGNERYAAGQREGDIADQMIGALAGKSPALAGLVFGLKLLFGQSDEEKNQLDADMRHSQSRQEMLMKQLMNLDEMDMFRQEEDYKAGIEDRQRATDFEREMQMEQMRQQGRMGLQQLRGETFDGPTSSQQFTLDLGSRQFPDVRSRDDVFMKLDEIDQQMQSLQQGSGDLTVESLMSGDQLEAQLDHLREKRALLMQMGRALPPAAPSQRPQQQSMPAVDPQTGPGGTPQDRSQLREAFDAVLQAIRNGLSGQDVDPSILGQINNSVSSSIPIRFQQRATGSAIPQDQ